MTAAHDSAAFQRRQRRLGWFVLVLAIATVAGALWSWRLDARQRECIEDSFRELTTTLNERSEVVVERNEVLARQDALFDREVSEITQLILDVSQRPTREEAIAMFHRFSVAVAEIRRERRDLDAALDKLTAQQGANPVPPFPEGRCD